MVMDRLNAHKADNPSMGEVRCWHIYDALISFFFFPSLKSCCCTYTSHFLQFLQYKVTLLEFCIISYSVFWTIFSSLCFFPVLICQLIFSWGSGGWQCKSCFSYFLVLCYICVPVTFFYFTSNPLSDFSLILHFIWWNFK